MPTDPKADKRGRTAAARGRSRWVLGLGAGAVLAVVVASLAALSTLRTGRVSVDVMGAPRAVKDRLDVLLLVRDVDTTRQEAKLRLYVEPVGRFADDAGRFAETIEMDSSNEVSAAAHTAEKGAPPLITDFVTTFDQGDDVSFPFDAYRSTIWIEATRGDGSHVPMRVRFEAADSTFRYATFDTAEAPSQVDTAFELLVERSGLTKLLALVIVAMMWAFAIAVGAVTWLVISRPAWRQRAFEVLGWLAAMLFALIQLRGVAPGAPGFGTLFDFIGFFWAEMVTATALCTIVAVLIRSEVLRRSPDRPT